jgi:hypothetical protein
MGRPSESSVICGIEKSPGRAFGCSPLRSSYSIAEDLEMSRTSRSRHGGAPCSAGLVHPASRRWMIAAWCGDSTRIWEILRLYCQQYEKEYDYGHKIDRTRETVREIAKQNQHLQTCGNPLVLSRVRHCMLNQVVC